MKRELSKELSDCSKKAALIWGLVVLSVVGLTPGRSHASVPLAYHDPNEYQLTSIAAAYDGGFWVQLDLWSHNSGGAGITLRKDDAAEFENVPRAGSIASIPGRNGYWIVTSDGKLFARGNARELCDGDLSNCSGFYRLGAQHRMEWTGQRVLAGRQ
jgi:hypothetical protein